MVELKEPLPHLFASSLILVSNNKESPRQVCIAWKGGGEWPSVAPVTAAGAGCGLKLLLAAEGQAATFLISCSDVGQKARRSSPKLSATEQTTAAPDYYI